MLKAKKLFANKYCDLLVHASITKCNGPDKLFLNNRMIKRRRKIVSFVIFVVMKPAERSVE